jgi:hypothetical protein
VTGGRLYVTTDTKPRHITRDGDNVFLDLGFPPKESKFLLRQADRRIDQSIRLKKELMNEIARWMKGAVKDRGA